jgi:hypothetical protein
MLINTKYSTSYKIRKITCGYFTLNVNHKFGLCINAQLYNNSLVSICIIRPVRTVTSLGLDNHGTGIWCLGGLKFFSSDGAGRLYLLFISYQGLFPWCIKLLVCEVVTHLHLAPWVRLWSFIHSTIHSRHGALPFTIFPLFELIVLHAYKYILHCIWSFYSTTIHICKSCDFFYLNL